LQTAWIKLRNVLRNSKKASDTLQQQQDAVRALLNSMGEYTKNAEEEIRNVTELVRANARAMIRSTLAGQQHISQPTAVEPDSTEEVARQIEFTHTASAEGVSRNPGAQGVIHLNANGMHWPKLTGARGASMEKFRDPFFHEPLYQQAYGLRQGLDNHTKLMISDRRELEIAIKQIRTNASANNTVYAASMINIIFTFFENNEHNDAEILALMTDELGLKYSDAPMWKPCIDTPLDRMKILAAP
jgi:hypothetical protein